MVFPRKKILINNFEKLEEYLDREYTSREEIRFIELRRNFYHPGVQKLYMMIPEGFNPDRLQEFYEKTGLNIRVEVSHPNYEMVLYDRKGRYPREDAAPWNPDFMWHYKDHPEWLEPEDEADLLIRYSFYGGEEESGNSGQQRPSLKNGKRRSL